MFSLNKILRSLFAAAVFLTAGIIAEAQNINSPNKTGPLGLEVNTLSGNLFAHRNDLFIPSRGIEMNLTFFYNSFFSDTNFGFGNGWTSIYSIYYKNDTANGKTIFWGDGREDSYTINGTGYKSPAGIFNTLSQYQPGKFLVQKPDGLKVYFDNSVHKKVTRTEEPNGNYLNFSYTDTLLTGITNTAGQTITLAYNSKGNLSSITDALASPSRTCTYQYDGNGNLKQVTDPAGSNTQYSYLVNGPLKTVSDKNNNTVDVIYYPDFTVSEMIGCNKRQSFSYDTTLNVSTVTDYIPGSSNLVTKYEYQRNQVGAWLSNISGNCCGFNMSFQFDAAGNKIKETDANGNSANYTYDDRGNLLTIKDAQNRVSAFTYSADYSNLLSLTDAKGQVYKMDYDSKGNLTKLTEPGSAVFTAAYNSKGDLVSATDAKGNVNTVSYDAYGSPTDITGPEGYHSVFTNDARGNLLAYKDSRGNTHTAQLDLLDRVKKITDPYNNFFQLNYDAEGNITSTIDKNNETSVINYDASNRMVKFTDPTGSKTEISYDAMDNLTGINNALGNKLNLSYDNRNRISGVQDALGNSSSMGYDANGNITSLAIPGGRNITYSYDNMNRITSISDAAGTFGTFMYDNNNNVTSITYGDGEINAAAYDSLNRMIKFTDGFGSSSTLTYDKNNNPTSFTDRNGFTRNYTYDGLNRVSSFTNNNSSVVSVTYDAEGNPVAVKDQNNNVTSYAYDSLNRVKTVTYADSKYIQFGYDKKGNIISKRLTDGTVATLLYDTLNRITAKTFPGGVTNTYTYDALGRLVTAANSTGAVAITYDAINRITSEAFDGLVTRYAYNTSGRTQTITYPDSTVVTRSYDTRNRLTGIVKNNSAVVTYQYNSANKITNKSYVNGVKSDLQFDFAGRLSNISTASGGIQNTTFTYDKENNKTLVTRLNNPALSEQFTYDKANRIIDYKRGINGGTSTIHNTYSYDALGNRTSAMLNGITVNYTYNPLNQLTASSGSGQNINFNYDNNGNLKFDGNFFKSYDGEGQLLKDSSSPANILTYQYDALGRRVRKNVNGASFKYSYSGLSQIEERNGVTNALLKRTIFKSFLSPVLLEKNGSSYYYHQNEMNSVEALTNAAGNVAERYQYDVYGKPVIYDASGNLLSSSAIGNRYGFTGQEYDSATLSYHFHFRDYSPATGTFNQRDLIGYSDGMGMYQYVGDNPANGVDILGLDDCKQKDKLSFEVVPPVPSMYLTVTQVGLDQLGATSTIISITTATGEKSKATFQLLKAAADANYLKMGEDAYKGLSLSASSKIWSSIASSQYIAPVSKALTVAGPVLGTLDLGVKAATLYNTTFDASKNSNDVMDAQADVVGSGANLIGGLAIIGASTAGSVIAVPAAIGLGVLAISDAIVQRVNNGKNIRQTLEQPTIDFYNATINKDAEYRNWLKTFGLEDSEFLQNIYNTGKGDTYLRVIHHQQGPKPGCPQNPTPPTGTRKRKFYHYEPNGDSTEIVQSKDPNAIIGPDGLGASKYWVNAKDPLPYTILYENDLSASAPAKYVKVVYPIADKQDGNTFYLGTFGFNNQNFTVPSNAPSYAQRLDCRDSLGLYVDVTAGLDVITNTAFWEFQSIDPVTLLPPSDPLKGLLLLQDLSKPTQGHGFVNFSIKAKSTDVTLDTIHATAKIVFDRNDTIPTNYAKNTVDAFAPTSHLNTLPATSNNPVFLSWSGADDAGGCGLKNYTLYASTDGVNFNILNSGITRKDTTFTGAPGTMYYFFVLATDSVGNTESLRPGEVRSTFIGGTLPVTLLYFKGTNQGKDNLLEWATANEQNTKLFTLERSLNNTDFSSITNVAAAGTSSVTTYYQYKDKNIDKLKSAVMYYRLKQTDIGGEFKYSNMVRLNYLQERLKSLVYPNPTHDIITLVVGDNTLIGTPAYLVDVNGKLLETIKITGSSQQLQMNKYLSGTYFIRLSNKETIAVIKL